MLGVVQVFNVLLNFFLSDDRSLTNLWDIARYNAITLFWASGNPADGIPSCGMPWFLFALLFPKGDFAVSFIVMLFGAYIGQVQYLPQCLDVAMVVVMYLTLGQLFRQHQALLDRYRVPLFLAMLIPWAWCCQQGIYIELASRTYSNYILCASISVCGIWIFTIWMCLPVPSGKKTAFCSRCPAASGGTSCFPCCCLAAGHCCAPAGAG